jgi:UDP-N-acetylmuramoyl-tripeptide--D-alanyl-D-alanine ligase
MTTPLWTLADLIAATGAAVEFDAVGWVERSATQRPRETLEGVGSRKGLTQPTNDAAGAGPDASPAPHSMAGLDPAIHGPRADGPNISGISIDTRTIEPGDLFVALKDARDGHEFVTTAFEAGAAAALVSNAYVRQPGDGALLRVVDPLRALEELGRAARARLLPQAHVIAVTGSAGKTTTKEMLRACLAPVGKTHASEKSYNNHWGVPLTLARMPADTQYAVFEIGMNHVGEITPLTQMVRPHVAIVTTVAAVHLENFPNVEAIADAKAEIFSGLEPAGYAIIPRDNPHGQRLCDRAFGSTPNVVCFGGDGRLAYGLVSATADGELRHVTARLGDPAGQPVEYRVGVPGMHNAMNSLAVVAALDCLALDLPRAAGPLTTFGAPLGRGSRSTLAVTGGIALLIDESYNANPASMRAAIATANDARSEALPRLIAILGDMLELGPDAPALHAELAGAIEAANIDLVLAAGPLMRHLYDALPVAKRGKWAETSAGIEQAVLETVQAGDVVMIKGSNGSRMAPLVAALLRHNGVKRDD